MSAFLGIDLGTTYSVGAYINAEGQAETVLNSESEKITPSVVYFESKDSVVVGQPAKDSAYLAPDDVISLVKNVMGKKNPDGSMITFQTSSGEYTPEVVSGFILKKIVSDANAYLQPKEPITDVVVTIPAYFNDAQRKATENAIHIAGLNCIGMINEPTAAALYFADKNHMTTGDLLVYDLGGGTFDVTIVHIQGGNVEVKSTGGLSRVGGSFFDKRIVQTICTDLEKKHGIDLTKKEYAGELQDLYAKVEKAKIQLSGVTVAKIMVRAGSVVETYTLTREELEEIVSDLYQKTENVMKKALRDANLTKEQIDKVILVGGSSRIPYIYDHVKEFFGAEPSREVNPNEVVALGAALYGKQVLGGSETTIVDVCSHGIGIRAWDPKKNEEYNDILIKRNTKLPASVEQAYTLGADDARSLYLSVLEGDYREITDVAEICEVDVDLPQKLKKGTVVYLRLEIDINQLLHIYIRIPDAGNAEKEIVFDRKSNLSEAEVTKWKTSVRKAAETIDERNGLGGFFANLFGRKGKETQEANDTQSTENAGVKDSDSGPKEELIAPETKPGDDTEKKDKSKKIPKIVENVMQDYVGMIEVKEALRNYKSRYEMREKRSLFGRLEDEDRCIAVCGTSGMGITTASFIVAECLYKFGISAKPVPVVATREDIVKSDEQDVMQAMTDAIKDLFQQAMDGVLIIDEFDDFYSDNEGAHEMLAVNLLFQAYKDAEKRVTLVVAGDSVKIKKLFEKKEKFSRLFGSYTIDLIGYSADEYVQILHRIATKMGYVVDNLADSALERHIKGMSKMPEFKYIHYLEELLDRAKTDVANKASQKRHAKDEDYIIIRQENFQLAGGERSLEELLEELNNMVGLQNVKKQVNEMIELAKARKRAEMEGKKMPGDTGTMHMLFLGSAGTGKTTVASLVGEIYRELGVLPKGHMVEALRKDLISQYVGDTPKQVAAKVDEAMGGILFIDEAYSLCKGDDDKVGMEAVETLIPLMENRRKDFAVILAGYTTDMQKFLDNNEGFKSRCPNVITFEDYSLDELVEIFMLTIGKKGYSIEMKAKNAVRDILSRRMKGKDFGNGRGVRNLVDEITRRQVVRVNKLSDWGENEQFIIRLEDCLEDGSKNQDSVEDIIRELKEMTGLASVKKEVDALVNATRVNVMRKEAGLPPLGNGTLHMVFAGNPGTGKTTVARMIGRIYQALGVISRADVLEVKRNDLVGQYVGHTARKTVDVVQRALGGVLFIDEAYQLGEGGENDFGREAINTLVQELENHRDDFVCIVAGYTKDMQEKFMDVNPGLPSRFSRTITFDDYSVPEKLQIFQMNMHGLQYEVTAEALEKVRCLLESLGNEGKYANGRGVRNVQEQIIRNQGERLNEMTMTGQLPDRQTLVTILPEDVFV